MRWLLVIVLVNALVPDVGEAVEAVAHLATVGHLPHTATDPCDDGDGPEHGCSTTCHRCACCANLAVAPAEGRLSLGSAPSAAPGLAPVADLAAAGEPSRPFRPPIG